MMRLLKNKENLYLKDLIYHLLFIHQIFNLFKKNQLFLNLNSSNNNNKAKMKK
jgi:hypothetical protein